MLQTLIKKLTYPLNKLTPN